MNTELYESLTEREKEVLRLLASGHDAKSVAQVLELSVHTVNEYLRTARRKLDAPSSRAAARAFSSFEDEISKKLGDHEFLGDEKNGEAQGRAEEQVSSSTGSRSTRRAIWIGGIVAMLVILASVLALSSGMVTVGAPAQTAPAEASVSLPAEATVAAEDWVKLIDEKQWAASHQAMSETVNTMVTASEWEQTVAPVRASLGEFESRTASGSQRSAIMPGMPQGDYGVQQFNARYANHPEAIETVVMSREASGWKVIGYFVR